MACNRCNCYFSFWAIFLHIYLPNSLKNQNEKKQKTKQNKTKKPCRYHPFTMVYQNKHIVLFLPLFNMANIFINMLHCF